MSESDLAKGYDWWFRRGQARFFGTQQGKQNEMTFDALQEARRNSGELGSIRKILESGNSNALAVVESNRQMMRAQEDARRESARLAQQQINFQGQVAQSFDSLNDSIAGFREDFHAVSVREGQMNEERNQLLGSIFAENRRQTELMGTGFDSVNQSIATQTNHLLGVAPASLDSISIHDNLLTLIALKQQGALAGEGLSLIENSRVGNLLERLREAKREISQAEGDVRKSQRTVSERASRISSDLSRVERQLKDLDKEKFPASGMKEDKRNRLLEEKQRIEACSTSWEQSRVSSAQDRVRSRESSLATIQAEVAKLTGDEAIAFQALTKGEKLALDESAMPLLRTLASAQALDPSFHRELMQRAPEFRQGIEGVNMSLIETNEILKEGFGAVISQLDGYTNGICRELGLQREVIIESTELLARTFVSGMTTLDKNMQAGFKGLQSTIVKDGEITRDTIVNVGMALDSRLAEEGALTRETTVRVGEMLDARMQEEGNLTRDVVIGVGQALNSRLAEEGSLTRSTIIDSANFLGSVIERGVSALSGTMVEGFEGMDKRLGVMTQAFSQGLQVVDENVRNGFFAVQEQMAQEGSANREVVLKAAEYVSQIFLTGLSTLQKDLSEGFSALDKRAEYANYLSEILVQEALKSNQLLDGVGTEIAILNRNVFEGRMEAIMQHGELLDALAYYDGQTAVRHREHMGHLAEVENILLGISDGIQQVREGVDKIAYELATKETWFLDRYKAAESFRMQGLLDDAIAVYEAIIAPDACPHHYASHVALVDCYLLEGNIEKSLKAARRAKASAQLKNRTDLMEESHIMEVGVRYSQAEQETDEEKKEKMFEDMIQYFESLNVKDGVSDTAKLFYFGALYRIGLKELALNGLVELIQINPFAIFDIRKITPFEDFFKGDHLAFFRSTVLESATKFPSEVYMYMFRIFEAAGDAESMKLALQVAMKHHPAACMEAKIFHSPMVQELFSDDLKSFVEENKDTNYWGNDLIAYYYLARRFQLPFAEEIRSTIKKEMSKNASLKGIKSLFRLSIILGKDFQDYYETLYSKIVPNN